MIKNTGQKCARVLDGHMACLMVLLAWMRRIVARNRDEFLGLAIF
jgi:hypothetical protein